MKSAYEARNHVVQKPERLNAFIALGLFILTNLFQEGASMKFNPGTIVMTRGVNDLIADNEEFAKHAHLSLVRHLRGDWGDVCEEDREANEEALQHNNRLFSVYKKDGLPNLWIITEWDRSVTTLLFPDEY